MSSTEFQKVIHEKEFELARLKAVFHQFPDVEENRIGQFHSSAVNKTYTCFEFSNEYSKLEVMPYVEVSFNFDGQTHLTKVYSTPIKNALMYFTYERDEKGQHRSLLQCSKMAYNLKSKKFSDKMVSECAAEMIDFIKKNPKYELSKKNLPERLEKLLNFA